MAVERLTYQSTVSATGWTGAGNVASSDGVRATGGTAGEVLNVNLTDAPGDYGDTNSGNTVELRVEARTVGAISRQKQITLDLLDAGNNPVLDSVGAAITFSTGNLTASDAIYTSGLFTLPGNYTAATVDGWRLRATVTEGGGMPDSATVEIDEMSLNLDYDLPPTGITGSGGGTMGALAALGVAAALVASSGTPTLPGLSSSGAGEESPALVRTHSGLLYVGIANDGDHPFSLSDWEAQHDCSLSLSSGKLEETGSTDDRRFARLTASGSRTKRMVQGLIEVPTQQGGSHYGISAHHESGTGGDSCVQATTTFQGAPGSDMFLINIVDEATQTLIDSLAGTGTKAANTPYRIGLFVDGLEAESLDFHTGTAFSGSATSGGRDQGWAGISGNGGSGVRTSRWSEYWDCEDRAIVCSDLPAGHKLKVRGSGGSVLKSETESSGTATLDLMDVSLAAIVDVVVTDASDVVLATFAPDGVAEELVGGGDTFEFRTTISGSGAPILPSPVGGGSGSAHVQGSGSAILLTLQSTASAAAQVGGTGSPQLPELTASAGAAILVNAAGSPDLPALTASGAGTVGSSAISGSGAPVLPGITSAGSGRVSVEGTGSTAVTGLTVNGAAAALVQGSGAGALPVLAGAGAGVAPIQGSGSPSIAGLSSAASGDVIVYGSGAPLLPALVGSGTAVIGSVVTGTGSPALPTVAGVGSASVRVFGAGTAELLTAAAASGGSVAVTGAGAPPLPALLGTGTSAAVVSGAGSALLVAATAAGAAEVAVHGTGSPALPGLASAGAGTVPGAHQLAAPTQVAPIRPESRTLAVAPELRTVVVEETRIVTVVGGK